MTRSAARSRASGSAPGELPGHRGGRGHLDDRVQPEPDQRRRRRHGAGRDRHDGLDDVVGDGRGDQEPHPAGEDGPPLRVAAGPVLHGAGAARLLALGLHRQRQRLPCRLARAHVLASAVSRHASVVDTASTTRASSPSAAVRCGSARSYRVWRPSSEATTSPQPRRQARWFDTLDRERPRSAASSAGYARAVEQGDQEAAPRGVGQGPADARERRLPGLTGQHALNRTATTEQSTVGQVGFEPTT